MAGSRYFPQVQGLLSVVARDNLLVASGFAEGRAHTNILESTLSVEKNSRGLCGEREQETLHLDPLL